MTSNEKAEDVWILVPIALKHIGRRVIVNEADRRSDYCL